MSGCHDTNQRKFEAMTSVNMGTGEVMCIACHSLIEKCHCIWAAIRELQRNMITIKDYFDCLTKDNVIANHAAQLIKINEWIDSQEGKLQEEVNAQFWFDQADEMKRKVTHLEKRLHQRNVAVRELTEAYQNLQKEYGERGRKLNAALTDLHCAIMNDRKSNEALMEAKISINRLHDQLEKAEASCAERVGHLGKALHCLQEENNELRKKLHGCGKTNATRS